MNFNRAALIFFESVGRWNPLLSFQNQVRETGAGSISNSRLAALPTFLMISPSRKSVDMRFDECDDAIRCRYAEEIFSVFLSGAKTTKTRGHRRQTSLRFRGGDSGGKASKPDWKICLYSSLQSIGSPGLSPVVACTFSPKNLIGDAQIAITQKIR